MLYDLPTMIEYLTNHVIFTKRNAKYDHLDYHRNTTLTILDISMNLIVNAYKIHTLVFFFRSMSCNRVTRQ